MKVKKVKDVAAQEVGPGATLRWVISAQDGAENFFMRVVEVEAGGQGPPSHSHPYEHEIFILEGRGKVIGDGEERPFETGDVIFIPPDEPHHIEPEGRLRFICLVPASEALQLP
ncbi:MAG: cupin domain-containing protein [Deltaproteobacteria bacterium]|nr:cupin domain-containing protein [Deltaproteobacteria bacterium]